MMSGFSKPWNPIFIAFITPKYSKNIRKYMGASLKHIIFAYMDFKKMSMDFLCGYVAMWLCGSVAMQLCSYVAIWLCGYVAMWLCRYVAMWLVGCWLLVVGCWLLVVGCWFNINQPIVRVSKGIFQPKRSSLKNTNACQQMLKVIVRSYEPPCFKHQ